YDPGYEGEEVIYPRYDHAGYLTDDELQHVRALYAGSITMMDRAIGRLIQKVQDLGLWDNTAIAFISDHGWYHGEHNYIGKHTVIERDKGWQFYDEVARIPLLIRAPNLPAGITTHALCQPVDVAPTLMELLGLPAPADVHGRSVLRALTGSEPPAREIAVTARDIPLQPGVRSYHAITDGKWTLQHAAAEAEPELYLTASDPAQENNLFAECTETAELLHERYLSYLAELGCTNEQIEARRALRPTKPRRSRGRAKGGKRTRKGS
ncbi:MAG: sulfatase, partial [Armatimonadota bacterium]